MNKEDNANNAARYYASPQEQKILVQGLIRYFSLPERSQNRNKIVKEVASYLALLSPHWSHRAVRLWFNNNRHTYLPTLKDAQLQQNISIAMNNQQEKQSTPNQLTPYPSLSTNMCVNMNNMNNLNMNMNITNSSFQQQIATPSNIPTEQQFPSNPQIFPMYPMNSTENMTPTTFFNTPQIPQTLPSNCPPVSTFQNQFFTSTNNNNNNSNNISSNNSNSNFMQTYQFGPNPSIQVNPPMNFQPPQQKPVTITSPQKTQSTTDTMYQFQSKTNSENMNKNNNSNNNNNNNNQFFFQDQVCEQSYITISAMLNEIRNLYGKEGGSDKRISSLVSQFEREVMQDAAKNGSIPPEKIEPMVEYISYKFPSPSEDGNLGDNVFPYSGSTNDFSEINDRSMTFGQATVWDQITPNNIWQQRPFVDETLTYFESCLLTDEYFAFTSPQLGSMQRTFSVKKYRCQTSSVALSVYQLGTESVIDSMCINNGNAFLLSKKAVTKLSLSNSYPKTTINLDSILANLNTSVSAGLVKSFGQNMAVVSYSTIPSLFVINDSNTIQTVQTVQTGIIDIASFGSKKDSFLVCSSNSPTVRLFSAEGAELAAFFGHLGQVMGVEPLSETLFASRGADKTVRIWDIRQPRMISTISTPKVSTLCITGSRNFVICGFSNRNIAVADIRKEPGKPFLGVSTQDYNAIMMSYNSDDDSLMMFGQVEKDTNKDSMIFVDTNGHSRKSILRQYSHFVGVDCK